MTGTLLPCKRDYVIVLHLLMKLAQRHHEQTKDSGASFMVKSRASGTTD